MEDEYVSNWRREGETRKRRLSRSSERIKDEENVGERGERRMNMVEK